MVIRGQLDAIANDILNLEDEVRAAGNDETLIQYRNASATYAAARGELETADTAAELTDLATRLDVAIWQLDVTEAPRREPSAFEATSRAGCGSGDGQARVPAPGGTGKLYRSC